MMRAFLFALAAILAAPFALAEDPAACPATAEQDLYTMAEKINAGQQAELQPVLDLARQTIDNCQDRAHAQALAALLMSTVINTAQDAETYGAYLSLLNTAIIQNDLAADDSPPKLVMTTLDGTSQDFFGYDLAKRIYEGSVLPGFVRLWQNGVTHPLVAGEGLTQCPFARDGSDRLDDEVLFWGKVAGALEVNDRRTLIRTRLKTLYGLCPDGELKLSFALAQSYGGEMVRLTDWDRNVVGMNDFGGDRVEYTVPALPGETFDTTGMRAKKAELDEQARALVPFVQQYVSDYEAAYQAVDTSGMSSNERRAHSDMGFSRNISVKRWEEAIRQLELAE